MQVNYYYLAVAYGECNYGAGNYNENSCDTATTSTGGDSTGTSGGGTLTNTGLEVLVIATLACVLIFVALLARFWRRPKHNASAAATSPTHKSDDL